MAENKKGPGRPKGSKNNSTSSKDTTNNSSKAPKKNGAKAKEKAQAIQAQKKADKRVIDEIWAIVTIALGVFVAISVFTTGAGKLGVIIATVLKGLFGHIAWGLPFILIVFGVLLFARKTSHFSVKTILLFVLLLCMLCVMNSSRFVDIEKIKWTLGAVKGFYSTGAMLESGGFFGMIMAGALITWLDKLGCWIFAITVSICCLLLIINTPVSRFFQKIGDKIEERRLVKENAHLDDEPEEIEVISRQLPMTEATENTKSPRKQREIRIVNGNQNGKLPSPQEKREAYIPVSQVATIETPKREKKKSNILGFMNDESLFGGRGQSGSVGLEEQRENTPGYGIHDNLDNSKASSTGLSDDYQTSASSNLEDKAKKFKNSMRIVSAFDNDQRAKSTSDITLKEDKYTPTGAKIIPNLPKATQSPVKTSADAPEAPFETSSYTYEEVNSKDSAKVTSNVSAPQTGAKLKETPESMTNKEAKEAMLTEGDLNTAEVVRKYEMPPIDLLERNQSANRTNNQALHAKAMKLEDTLRSFGVDASVIQVIQGPAVTRFEIQPAVGVKVSKIVNLADDIALNLEAKSIRIEAPIPGKPAVGIEIENETSSMIKLRDIIESDAFRNAKSKISFAVGKDIGGNCIVGNLEKMPHMLIAGSTGSGKSVCINSIILSILFKAKPEEVKLILVDPKVVELSNYNGIPHLMIPVVTEPQKAAAALNWAVAEMEDRYRRFAEMQVRELESYNEAVRAEEDDDKVLPQIVIIIDEMADLMTTAPKQIEESIARLAAKARAAGIHLIVATQRPSVDVITGVIKANIPSRIAFAVSSQIDSRTILDMQGAENLVGKGDMLYNPIGMAKPLRVQGTFVSDHEVNDVVNFVKAQVEGQAPNYNNDVISRVESQGSGASQNDDTDEFLTDAVELVVNSGQASVSMLQRRFRIGYNRAARIVDMMEARGIVGPQDGSRPRQVLISQEEFEMMKAELNGEGE